MGLELWALVTIVLGVVFCHSQKQAGGSPGEKRGCKGKEIAVGFGSSWRWLQGQESHEKDDGMTRILCVYVYFVCGERKCVS